MTASALVLLLTLATPATQELPKLPTHLLPFPLTEAQRDELESGEILSRLADADGAAVQQVEAIATVDAPAERVFRVVTDLDAFAEFLPNVRESRIESREGEVLINFQSLDLPFVRDRHYRIRVRNETAGPADAPVYRSRWQYEPGSGNIVDSRGSWEVVPLTGVRSLVIYRAFVDPGGGIPKWFVETASRRGVPDLIEAVRRRVEHPKYGSETVQEP